MELSTAIKLIEQGVDKNSAKQKWADLGAGSGLFTHGLATLLRQGSVIQAIDKDSAVRKIKSPNSSVKIEIVHQNFVNAGLGDDLFDGILMANSLHYVEDKFIFFQQLKKNLHAMGRLVIVEYDMTTSNRWVPFPIPFVELLKLTTECGFVSPQKLHEVPSIYHQAKIYSALIKTS